MDGGLAPGGTVGVKFVMSQSFQLLSMTNDPTHPLGFSSLRNGQSTVTLLKSGDLFAVFEKNPVNLMNAMEDMSGSPRSDLMFHHPYALSVFYRKSRNPHGPSTRPVYIATFEYSPVTCRMRSRGLLGALTGAKAEPAEVYMIGNGPRGRDNAGLFPYDFTESQAMGRLARFVDERLGLDFSASLRHPTVTSEPWDPAHTS